MTNPELLAQLVPDGLTAGKAKSILDRGYEVTGFVLFKPRTQERSVIEMNAVRWINEDDWWDLMHPKE